MNRVIGLALATAVLPRPGLAAHPEAAPATMVQVAGSVADSLTVEEAVRRVLDTHPEVQEATEGVSASRARVRERETAFSPVVVGGGSFARVGPVPTLEIDDRSFSLFPANNYAADLTLRHTVWDGGRRESAVAVARTLETTAGENVEAVRSRLAYRTVDAFYGILFLRQSLMVQDEEIEALGQHLEVTQGRVEAGTATDFDVLTTQVRIAAARSQRVDVADALEARTIELRQLLGLAPDRSVEPVGDFQVDSAALDTDSLVAAALEQRPEVRLSRSMEASARVKSRLASLGERPSVSVGLSLGAKNGYIPNLDQIRPDWTAGLSVEIPVYDGERTRSQVDGAEAEVAAAAAHTRALERSVATEVEQAVAAMRASREKIESADVQVRQATAALTLARTRYEAGAVTNLEVLDAQTLLSQATLVQLRARYDLVRSRYRLEQAVGARVW